METDTLQRNPRYSETRKGANNDPSFYLCQAVNRAASEGKEETDLDSQVEARLNWASGSA
jgi:hypothetical protein